MAQNLKANLQRGDPEGRNLSRTSDDDTDEHTTSCNIVLFSLQSRVFLLCQCICFTNDSSYFVICKLSTRTLMANTDGGGVDDDDHTTTTFNFHKRRRLFNVHNHWTNGGNGTRTLQIGFDLHDVRFMERRGPKAIVTDLSRDRVRAAIMVTVKNLGIDQR